jgi:hypothetical protein
VKQIKSVFTPPARPQLDRRVGTIMNYIADLEHCLGAANARITERDAAIECLSGRLPCLCGICPRLSRCENGGEGGAV